MSSVQAMTSRTVGLPDRVWMPEWPEHVGYTQNERGDISVVNATIHAVVRYERARADAWEARCRVAVELLQSSECGSGAWCDDRDEALATIGPLPQVRDGEG